MMRKTRTLSFGKQRIFKTVNHSLRVNFFISFFSTRERCALGAIWEEVFRKSPLDHGIWCSSQDSSYFGYFFGRWVFCLLFTFENFLQQTTKYFDNNDNKTHEIEIHFFHGTFTTKLRFSSDQQQVILVVGVGFFHLSKSGVNGIRSLVEIRSFFTGQSIQRERTDQCALQKEGHIKKLTSAKIQKVNCRNSVGFLDRSRSQKPSNLLLCCQKQKLVLESDYS